MIKNPGFEGLVQRKEYTTSILLGNIVSKDLELAMVDIPDPLGVGIDTVLTATVSSTDQDYVVRSQHDLSDDNGDLKEIVDDWSVRLAPSGKIISFALAKDHQYGINPSEEVKRKRRAELLISPDGQDGKLIELLREVKNHKNNLIARAAING